MVFIFKHFTSRKATMALRRNGLLGVKENEMTIEEKEQKMIPDRQKMITIVAYKVMKIIGENK